MANQTGTTGEQIGKWLNCVAVEPSIERLVCAEDITLNTPDEAQALANDLSNFLLSRQRIIEFDLRAVAQPNSALIGCIMRARLSAQTAGIKLVVLASPQMAELLRLSKVDQMVEVRTD
jgi:anti-anti-sigma regulatory factor